MTGALAEDVERSVCVADVHAAVRKRWGGVEVLAPVQEARVRRRAPELAPRPRVQRVDVTAVRPEEDAPICVGGRAVDLRVGWKCPAQTGMFWVRGVDR